MTSDRRNQICVLDSHHNYCFNVSGLSAGEPCRALSCTMLVSAELKCFWVQATAMPKGLWKYLLLSTALGSSSSRNPFQGHCPERIDHLLASWPPESQEMASPTMKNLSRLMIHSLQKWPCHLFNHYSFFLVLSFHAHCLLVCSAQRLWLLQVVNTIGTNLCRAPWAVGTAAHPIPAPVPKLPLSYTSQLGLGWIEVNASRQGKMIMKMREKKGKKIARAL